VALDDWSEDEIDAMIEVGGNASANSIYEANIPEGVTKPGPDADHEQRSNFIRLDLFSYTQCTVCILFLASLIHFESFISTMK